LGCDFDSEHPLFSARSLLKREQRANATHTLLELIFPTHYFIITFAQHNNLGSILYTQATSIYRNLHIEVAREQR